MAGSLAFEQVVRPLASDPRWRRRIRRVRAAAAARRVAAALTTGLRELGASLAAAPPTDAAPVPPTADR